MLHALRLSQCSTIYACLGVLEAILQGKMMFSSKITVGVVQLTLDDLVNTCHFGSSFKGRPNMVQKAVQPLSHAWETHKLPCRSYKRSLPLCICLSRHLSDFRGAGRYSLRVRNTWPKLARAQTPKIDCLQDDRAG
jgi:hypothetical protein